MSHSPCCPVCHHPNSIFLFSSFQQHGRHLVNQETFDFFRCPSCQTVFPHVLANSKFYSTYYPTDTYYQVSPLTNLINKFSFLAKRLIIDSRLHTSHPKILDVGCGSALFLQSLPANFHKSGIDVNLPPLSLPNITLTKGDFITSSLPGDYDVITLWHVIEHFSNPSSVITRAHKLLAPDGIICLTTPNINSLGFRLGTKDWYHLDAPRHLSFLTPINLVQLLSDSGFHSIQVINTFWEFPLDLFWSLKHSPYRFLLYPLYPIIKLLSQETVCIFAQK